MLEREVIAQTFRDAHRTDGVSWRALEPRRRDLPLWRDIDANGDVPACLKCGCCCFSTLERYAAVTGDDYSRLGNRADELVGFIGNKAFMRLVDGHCGALRIEVAGEFFCSVYEQRPAVCRELARGSPACAGERSRKHHRPLIALRRR